VFYIQNGEVRLTVVSPRGKSILVPRKVFWGALQGVLLTGRLAKVFNVPAPAGFLVKTVAQGSMAWNMSLQGATGSSPSPGKRSPSGATSSSRSRTSCGV
jgi:hypothetical protein